MYQSHVKFLNVRLVVMKFLLALPVLIYTEITIKTVCSLSELSMLVSNISL